MLDKLRLCFTQYNETCAHSSVMILNSLMHCFLNSYTSIKKCPFYLWHFTNIKYIFTSSNKSWYFFFEFYLFYVHITYTQRNPLNQTQTVVILRNVLEISIFESKRLSPSIFKFLRQLDYIEMIFYFSLVAHFVSHYSCYVINETAEWRYFVQDFNVE